MSVDHLLGDFFEDVVDAGEVLLGGLEAELGEALFGLEAGDAGGLFDDGAAVEGLGAEQLADALLADDGVGLAAEAGAHEDVLNVAQAADLAVEQIFGVAGAEEAAGDGDLAGADRGAAELAAADLEDDVVRVGGEGGFGVGLGVGVGGGVGGHGCCGVGGFAFDDGAGLGLGDGLFGLGGALLAEGGLVPVADIRRCGRSATVFGVVGRGRRRRRPRGRRG